MRREWLGWRNNSLGIRAIEGLNRSGSTRHYVTMRKKWRKQRSMESSITTLSTPTIVQRMLFVQSTWGATSTPLLPPHSQRPSTRVSAWLLFLWYQLSLATKRLIQTQRGLQTSKWWAQQVTFTDIRRTMFRWELACTSRLITNRGGLAHVSVRPLFP